MSGAEKYGLTAFIMAVGMAIVGLLYFMVGDKTFFMEQGIWFMVGVLFVSAVIAVVPPDA